MKRLDKLKRILFILLVAFLPLGVLPMTALADEIPMIFSVSVSPDHLYMGKTYSVAVTVNYEQLYRIDNLKVGIEGYPVTYTDVMVDGTGRIGTATLLIPADLLPAGEYYVGMIIDGFFYTTGRSKLVVSPPFDASGRVYLVHKGTCKVVGSNDSYVEWTGNVTQTTLKAIYDSLGGVEEYTTYELEYGSGGTYYYMKAGNGKYLSIEGISFGGSMVRPRADIKSSSNWEALIFTPQPDGTIKISRIGIDGERWVNVRDNGELYSQSLEPGDSGKFYLRYYDDLTNLPTLTGIVSSYNPNTPATVQLLRDGKESYIADTEKQPGSGPADQTFTFSNVAPGDYTLVVTKPGHASYTMQKVSVGTEDVDLTPRTRDTSGAITLPCGDISGDGMINDGDLAILWLASNYNKSAGDVAVNELCDLNGDGMINDGDLAILWLASNYNKGSVVVG